MRGWIVGIFLLGLGFGAVSAFPPKEVTYSAPVEAGNGLGETLYNLPPEEMLPEGISFISSQTEDWSHRALNIADSRKFTKGKGAVLAILDTGIDVNHPEFRGRIKASKNFTPARSGIADIVGHGTHCAGIAAAADDGEGTVGIAPEATLVIGKVLDDRGSGLTSWIAAGIQWAVDDQGADVISLSLGADSYDERLHTAVKYATDKGVVVVAAAGNSGPRDNSVGYPGGHPETICVASTGQSGVVSRFSSRGPQLFLAAPGESILATLPGNRFGRLSGTSMATPAVAGEVALIVAYRRALGLPRYTPQEVKAVLQSTIVDIAPTGKDTGTGWGRPEIAKALVASAPPSQPSPPTPEPPAPGPNVLRIYLEDLSPEKQEEVLSKWPNFKYFEIRERLEVIVVSGD